MTIALTQSDFREHIKDYLDQVTDEDETVYIARTNGRTATIISQDRLNWLEKAVSSREDSLDYAIARDQLIQRGILPDDNEAVESTNDYWRKFK
jgi:PHD/YefM family antitoxin component YafN of YafNO toxin-antitoxin module